MVQIGRIAICIKKIVEDFSSVGVDVVFLPHTEGVSSTMLAEKLEKIGTN